MRTRVKINCVEMVKEIRSLSSGTVSRLAGSTVYDFIDDYTSQWVQWVLAQPITVTWESWQDCHEHYVAHLNGEVGPDDELKLMEDPD